MGPASPYQIQKLEKDAMVAARNADRAAGYGDGERSGPAVEGVMRARLLCITGDRSTGRAMRFIDEDFRAEVCLFMASVISGMSRGC